MSQKPGLNPQKPSKKRKRDWHRLLGMFMTAHFENSPYEVEVEKDLTLKKQLIDIIIIRRCEEGEFERYPDGLDNMGAYNLLSYKSLHESFTVWSLLELGGHYVNYRKQVSPNLEHLLAADQFRLYGVTTHHPAQIIRIFNPQRIKAGVYELQWEDVCIRLIVLSQIPEGDYNYLWRLFSARPKMVEEARTHYDTHYKDSDHSILMQQLYEFYLKENLPMTYTRKQFEEDFVISHIKGISPEKILKQYSPEQVLKQYSPEQVLKLYSPEEMLKGLSPEQLKQMKELLDQATQ
jgi:hypothetical protein